MLIAMKIAIGKVVAGKVVLEGVTFEEGSSVTVLAQGEEGGITLAPAEKAELLLAIAEAGRGEMVSAEEVLARFARRHG
jgi:redox-sensitive bicupin YhaK (pirin superfamily)